MPDPAGWHAGAAFLLGVLVLGSLLGRRLRQDRRDEAFSSRGKAGDGASILEHSLRAA